MFAVSHLTIIFIFIYFYNFIYLFEIHIAVHLAMQSPNQAVLGPTSEHDHSVPGSSGLHTYSLMKCLETCVQCTNYIFAVSVQYLLTE